jgi:hypothetical protein
MKSQSKFRKSAASSLVFLAAASAQIIGAENP